MTRSSQRIGFLVSGALHLALLLAVTLPGPAALQSEPGATPSRLRLAMFVTSPDVAVAPAAELPAEPIEPVADEPVPATAEPSPQVTESVAVSPVAPAPNPPIEPEPPPVEPVNTPRQRHPETLPPPPIRTTAPRPARVDAATIVDRPARPAPPRAPATSPTFVASTERPSRDGREATHLAEAYLAALVAEIERRKFYPRRARRLREEGTVTVRFLLLRDGRLTAIEIDRSSGSRHLDRAAIETVRRASPFRPLPDTLAREQWRLSLPVVYRLHR